MNKYYKILEFDAILDILKNEVSLEKSKETIDNFLLLDDLDDIKGALDFVDEVVVLQERMGKLPIYLYKDILPSLVKVSKGGVLSEEELVEVLKLIDTIRDINVYLEKLENNKIESPLFKDLVTTIEYPKDLNLKIKNIITPYGEIKDSASPALKDIRKRQKDTDSQIKNKLQEILNRYSDKLSQGIITSRNDRYVIPVKNDFKNQIKGIVHDTSSSGETVFIEPVQIFELSNKLSNLFEQEKQEIFNILRAISYEIDGYNDSLQYSYKRIIELDIVYAKARYAIRTNSCKPKVNKEGIVELLNCRHPLLNVSNVVSNNIILGKDYKGIIITGPNTGGKTVLLKTIGLLSIMVKYGMLIPANSNSNIMIFDNVYADIGDEQSISQNLSTFSSHLKNVIEIMNSVTVDSLVLLDELGSGTDPIEGASLAISIFDYLIEKRCLIVATSHYSELKMHAYNSSDMINASVEFDDVTLKPTYRLLIGVPGMSNALNIAYDLGLNEDVIKKAKEYVYKKSDDLNLMLDKLIKQSHELERKISEVEQAKKDLENKTKEANFKYQEIIDSKKAIIDKANQDAKLLINKSMNDINDLLAELKSLKGKGVGLPDLARLKHQANMLEENFIQESIIEEKKDFIVGENVYVRTYECYGKVNKVLSNNKYEIMIGNAKMKVDRDNLSKSDKDFDEPKIVNRAIEVKIKSNVLPNLDLRGKRYEEASMLIERYLDEASYSGLNQVTIIHGFGTGTVRKLVQEKVKESNLVKSYRYGGENEGGQGVTVVTFKD